MLIAANENVVESNGHVYVDYRKSERPARLFAQAARLAGWKAVVGSSGSAFRIILKTFRAPLPVARKAVIGIDQPFDKFLEGLNRELNILLQHAS